MKLTILTAAALGLFVAQLGSAYHARHADKPAAGNIEAGGAVFQQNCVMCHSSEPEIKVVGPSLYHITKGAHAWSPRAIREITDQGKGTMPSFHDKLTDQQVTDLLVYVRTL